MICLITLPVLAILGIFSAKYRQLAKEAFDCVFKRMTLRPCSSGLDERVKSMITGKLMKRSQKIAKFTFKHFEAISWVFTIIMVVSIVYSGIGIYNFVLYGNCNGANSNALCLLNGNWINALLNTL